VDNPENLPRTQESKERIQKTQEFERQGSVLRNEGRRGTAIFVGIVEPERVEQNPAAAEAEGRGVIEADIAIRIVELIASTVDPEIVVMLEAFRVRQDHDPDSESTEAELVDREDLTSPADRTSPMTDAELGSHHEDVVVLLLVAELLEHGRRLGRLAQALIVDLSVTVAVELASPNLLDRSEHLPHGLSVGWRDGLPLRDGEPSFGVGRNRTFHELLVGESDTPEDLARNVALLRDRPGLTVTGEVAVVRGDFLALELVGNRQIDLLDMTVSCNSVHALSLLLPCRLAFRSTLRHDYSRS